MRWEREGSNEAHGCLTSEVPSLASWGRLRHIYPPDLWLIPEDFNPVPGDPLLKSLATTIIKHTWSGQSSSSRLLENCRQVCWSRLEINFPGEWVPRSRVEDLWHIPSPKIITHSPIHVMKRIEFLKTHISPTHSSFLFHMRVYIDQSSLHTKKCCKCFCICCLTFFVCLFFSYVLNKSTTFVAAITGALSAGYDGLTSYPPAILGQSKEAHEIYKRLGQIQLTAKLTCSVIMGECVMIVVKSFTWN